MGIFGNPAFADDIAVAALFVKTMNNMLYEVDSHGNKELYLYISLSCRFFSYQMKRQETVQPAELFHIRFYPSVSS